MTEPRQPRAEHLRRFIAVIAIAVTVYYLYWRITETFNPNALLFSWALWGAEVFGAFSTFLFYFTTWKPIRRISPPPLRDRTVDVLVPTKSEPVSVLRRTLLACNDLKYAHRTLVLDDGNRPEVKALCDELQCIYLARTSHKGAKAGNLNFGLRHSNAEFVAVFDADHAPLPHFIDRLIGYFKDRKIAFVQTPQEFYNIDSFQHRVDPKKKYIWAEQYLFFSLIQPGRDYWNAAYFVGSCALMRRKALDEIGGFSEGSITEDMLTSINIHAKGWSSVYHNENLAFGIAAETILPFHIQRRRWGVGGWQVFFKANPLFKRGLSFSQRLCYLASLIYPIEGFQKLIFYVTPPIALFTGILPMRALDINYILHFVPYYAISLFAFNEMGRGYGGTLMLEQFSMGKFITYIGTLGAFLLPKREREFKVTPKGEHTLAPYSLITPQIIVVIVSISAIIWALLQLLLQMRHDEFIIAVNSLWALYNSGLGLAIILYAHKKLFQRRDHFRIPDSVPVLYSYRDRGEIYRRLAVANNVTKKGLSLLSIGKFPPDQKFKLEIILPKRIVVADGALVHEKTVTAKNHLISRAGLLFNNVSIKHQDTLSRYLSESAITKFMNEYTKRYETYVERQLREPRAYKKRAPRALTYIPVAVPDGDRHSSFGVIKNISETGLLLATQDHFSPGNHVTIVTVLETEIFLLHGIVVRTVRHESEDFPELLAGVQLTEPYSDRIGYIRHIAGKVGDLLQE